MRTAPNDATKVVYQPLGKARVEYYYWEYRGKWYWEALGNQGREETEQAARQAAKDWINGQAPGIFTL